MTKLELQITDHNKVADLLNKVLVPFYTEVEKFKGKKLFKADGSPVKRLQDKLSEINKSLPQKENVRLSNSYGNVDILVRSSYEANKGWHYFDGSMRIGKVDDTQELNELKELSELQESNQLVQKSVQDNKDSYSKTKAYFTQVQAMLDSLPYEERAQLREDFYFLR